MTDCEAPKETLVPLIVKEELANLSFEMLPDTSWFCIVPSAILFDFYCSSTNSILW
jgi:hypothetical protein